MPKMCYPLPYLFPACLRCSVDVNFLFPFLPFILQVLPVPSSLVALPFSGSLPISFLSWGIIQWLKLPYVFSHHLPAWGLLRGSRAQVGPRNVCILTVGAGIRSGTQERPKPGKRELPSLGKPRISIQLFCFPGSNKRSQPTSQASAGSEDICSQLGRG